MLYQCLLFLTGAPVAVGMNIDIASIDMVSEVNMVGAPFPLSLCLDASDRLRGTAGIHPKWASYHGSACVTTCDRIGRTRALFGRIHFTGAGRRGAIFNNIIPTHQRHPRLCLRICSSTVLLHLNSKHTLTGALGRTAPAARIKGYVRV